MTLDSVPKGHGHESSLVCFFVSLRLGFNVSNRKPIDFHFKCLLQLISYIHKFKQAPFLQLLLRFFQQCSSNSVRANPVIYALTIKGMHDKPVLCSEGSLK